MEASQETAKGAVKSRTARKAVTTKTYSNIINSRKSSNNKNSNNSRNNKNCKKSSNKTKQQQQKPARIAVTRTKKKAVAKRIAVTTRIFICASPP